jgi:hypothetical protein
MRIGLRIGHRYSEGLGSLGADYELKVGKRPVEDRMSNAECIHVVVSSQDG